MAGYRTGGRIDLWVEVVGPEDGTPVLLVSGANATALMWPIRFVEAIAEAGYRVIRYDHRDTGLSTKLSFDEAPYGMGDLAEDAINVLDSLKLERAHVVGMSMGGTIGQLLALDFPDRLLSLTLMQTAALDVDFAGNWMRALQGQASGGDLPFPKAEVVQSFTAPGHDRASELDRRVEQWRVLWGDKMPFDADEMRRREAEDIDRLGTFQPAMSHARAHPVPTDRARELANATVPTLVVQGMEDPLNPPPHGRHLSSLMPNASLIEIDGLGHALPIDAISGLAKEMISHFSQAE